MDQAEVYAGLSAASTVATTLGDSALAQRASADATRVRGGVAKLWNQATGGYDWAVHEDGTRVSTDWRYLYPDALEQAWAVAFGVVDGNQARALMTRFALSQPQWAQPGASAQYRDGTHAVGYWAPVGWAFNRVGQTDVASSAAASIRVAADSVGRAWPFTTADAGELLVLDQPVASSGPISPRKAKKRLSA